MVPQQVKMRCLLLVYLIFSFQILTTLSVILDFTSNSFSSNTRSDLVVSNTSPANEDEISIPVAPEETPKDIEEVEIVIPAAPKETPKKNGARLCVGIACAVLAAGAAIASHHQNGRSLETSSFSPESKYLTTKKIRDDGYDALHILDPIGTRDDYRISLIESEYLPDPLSPKPEFLDDINVVYPSKDAKTFVIPYKPVDFDLSNPGVLLDLILNDRTDGFVFTDLNKLVPELFTNPEKIPVDKRVSMIQEKLSEILGFYGVKVIAFLPQADKSKSARLFGSEAASIIADPKMTLVGAFKLWYTTDEKGADYPIAVANAHNEDGKYGTTRFNLATDDEKYGTIGVLNEKEFNSKLRYWSSKLEYGQGLFSNALLNLSVQEDSVSDDTIQLMFYAKKDTRPGGKDFWLVRQLNAFTGDISGQHPYLDPILRNLDDHVRSAVKSLDQNSAPILKTLKDGIRKVGKSLDQHLAPILRNLDQSFREVVQSLDQHSAPILRKLDHQSRKGAKSLVSHFRNGFRSLDHYLQAQGVRKKYTEELK